MSWLVDFKLNVEKEPGGGAINITTVMTFQEIGDGTKTEQNISFERNRGKDQSSLLGWQSVAVLFLPLEKTLGFQ